MCPSLPFSLVGAVICVCLLIPGCSGREDVYSGVCIHPGKGGCPPLTSIQWCALRGREKAWEGRDIAGKQNYRRPLAVLTRHPLLLSVPNQSERRRSGQAIISICALGSTLPAKKSKEKLFSRVAAVLFLLVLGSVLGASRSHEPVRRNHSITVEKHQNDLSLSIFHSFIWARLIYHDISFSLRIRIDCRAI